MSDSFDAEDYADLQFEQDEAMRRESEMKPSHGTTNNRTWQEAQKDVSRENRLAYLSCVIGALMVTSQPQDFARACETAKVYIGTTTYEKRRR